MTSRDVATASVLLSKVATDALGTPYVVELNWLATCAVAMVMRCHSCKRRVFTSFAEDDQGFDYQATLALPVLCDLMRAGGACRCVDGLTPAQCLERYQTRQRLDCIRLALTDRQLKLARSEWSTALRSKQLEARQREGEQVVCERDEDGL
jgi:hypothetical protein